MSSASIRTQLALFTIGVAIIAMTLGLAVTSLMPQPPAGRMSLDEMAYAMRTGSSKVIDIEHSALPPAGQRSDLIERALASAMGLRSQAVRAVWRDLPGGIAGRGQTVLLIDRRDVLVEAKPGGFTLRYGEGAELRSSTLLPLFSAAVRTADGSWRIGVPRDPQREAWRLRIVLTYLFGLMLLTPLAWLVAGRIAGPVTRLGRAAQTASPAAKDPFPIEGGAEIRAAATAMNAMHQRLREHASEQARLFAAIAHDLRTPLTALRLRAETLLPEVRARFVADLDRITAMTADLLDRTRLAATIPRPEPVDLAAALTRWCGDWREAGHDVTCKTPPAEYLVTDPMLLRRIVDNLIDNAIRYAGSANVALARNATSVIIEICDPGRGIDQSRVADMLAPFVRSDQAGGQQASEGAGLGLSIASDLAKVLGGTLQLGRIRGGFRAALTLDGMSPERPKT